MYSSSFTTNLTLCLFALVCSFMTVNTCKVTSEIYTGSDGTVLTDQVHGITITADCPTNVVPAYADLNGRTLAVVRGENAKTFHITWATELSKASSGSYQIGVFDEDGYQAFKRNSNVSPLFTIAYSHSSPYRGPYIQSEFFAVAIGLVLSYYALVLRYRIVNKKV